MALLRFVIPFGLSLLLVTAPVVAHTDEVSRAREVTDGQSATVGAGEDVAQDSLTESAKIQSVDATPESADVAVQVSAFEAGFESDRQQGETCAIDGQGCAPGLLCCYPCGVTGCQNVCTTPDPQTMACPLNP